MRSILTIAGALIADGPASAAFSQQVPQRIATVGTDRESPPAGDHAARVVGVA